MQTSADEELSNFWASLHLSYSEVAEFSGGLASRSSY